tara:strand:+ start:175 stop:993 length:819 start_codon:yes stop_codon:yes gene_type:complete
MRNNQRRTGAAMAGPSAQPQSLNFVVPTEFVELPSEGKYYPSDHPLHNQKTVEIKFMTAKEEDILSSEALIKNNLVIDRLIESLLLEDISAETLLLGDRSAILMAARISGYGRDYKITHRCRRCFHDNESSFDLTTHTVSKDCLSEKFLQSKGVVYNDDTLTFDVTLPTSGVDIGLRLMTSEVEKQFSSYENKEGVIVNFLSIIITKVNQNTDPSYVRSFIEAMPARDSKYIRDLYPQLTPSVKMIAELTCEKCYTQSEEEVPLTAEFFWPE